MPLRSRTQLSLVSMILESIVLSTSSGGTQMPVPARTARAWVMRKVSLSALLRTLPQRRESGGGHPAVVEHGQIAAFDETVEGVRTLTVQPGRRVGAVDPDFERRPVADGRHLVVDLLRQAVEHVEDTAVGAAPDLAGLAVEGVGGGRAVF